MSNAVKAEPSFSPNCVEVSATLARIPAQAKIIFLNSYLAPENGHADVLLAVSIQTERAGHYTNFQGVVSRFEPCFPKGEAVLDAELLFKALEAPARGHT